MTREGIRKKARKITEEIKKSRKMYQKLDRRAKTLGSALQVVQGKCEHLELDLCECRDCGKFFYQGTVL